MKENPACLAFNAACIALLLPFAFPETWAAWIAGLSVAALAVLLPFQSLVRHVRGGENSPGHLPLALTGALTGLFLASLVILFSPAIAKGCTQAPGPGPAGILEGVLDQDARIRTLEGRTWYVVDVSSWTWTDSHGRSFKQSTHGGTKRISLLDAPGNGDAISECGNPADPARLAFAGDRVSIALETSLQGAKTTGGKLVDIQPARGLAGLRSRLLKSIIFSMKGLDRRVSGLVLALLLGRQDFIPGEDQEIFMKTGCVHLIALSGMHVTMVLGLGTGVFSFFLGGRKGRMGGLIMVCVLLWLVGPFPSAVRALLMCLWAGIARIAGYPVDQREALGLASLGLLVIQPAMLGQLGNQLSAFTLYGMMFLQAPLDRHLRPLIKPLPAARLAPGIAAQLASMPLLLANGLSWYPQGILASLLMEPLCLCLMVLGLLKMCMAGFAGLPFPGNPAELIDSRVVIPFTEAVFTLTRTCGGLFVWFP